MTEAEWLACGDPEPMVEFVHDEVSDRRLRLWACACCRRIWTAITDPGSRRAVEVAEQYADELVDHRQLEEARQEAWGVWDQAELHRPFAREAAFLVAARNAFKAATESADLAAQAVSGSIDPDIAERSAQCDLLRDIFGNPF